MKKKIYIKPEITELMFPDQLILANSTIDKKGGEVDDHNNLLAPRYYDDDEFDDEDPAPKRSTLW